MSEKHFINEQCAKGKTGDDDISCQHGTEHAQRIDCNEEGNHFYRSQNNFHQDGTGESPECARNEKSDLQCKNVGNSEVKKASNADVKKALSARDGKTFVKINVPAVVHPCKTLNGQHCGDGQGEEEPGEIIFAQQRSE